MVIYDGIGFCSACKARFLLRWSFNYDALQGRDGFDSSPSLLHIAGVSDFMGLRGMLFCTSIAEVITNHRVGATCMAMVQRVSIRYSSASVCCRRYQGNHGFSSSIGSSIHSTTDFSWHLSCKFHRYYSVSCVHTFWIRVVQMHGKRVLEGKQIINVHSLNVFALENQRFLNCFRTFLLFCSGNT